MAHAHAARVLIAGDNEVATVLKEMMPNVRIILFTMYSEAVAKAFPDKGLAADVVIAKADGVTRLAECVQSLLRS